MEAYEGELAHAFHNTTLGKLSLKEVLFHIKAFIEQDPERVYSLVIGTDSHERIENGGKKNLLNMVTAIVIYRHGFGGRYFWKRKQTSKIFTLRDKIYAETLESLDFAKYFIPLLQQTLIGKETSYDLEIHVDVGEKGATREMIKEVVGMVTGYGFVARTKPASFAASSVADKHT